MKALKINKNGVNFVSNRRKESKKTLVSKRSSFLRENPNEIRRVRKEKFQKGLNISYSDRLANWEVALDALKRLEGIIFQYKRRINDKNLKKLLTNRGAELHKEYYEFDIHDDKIVEIINKTYWPLIKEHNEDKRTFKEKIADRAYEKILTTKINYNAIRK